MSPVAIVRELDARRRQLHFEAAGRALGLREGLLLCARERSFRMALLDALRDAPFAAYFFELPALCVAEPDKPFEFVLTSAPELAGVPADARAFREHFRENAEVVVFANLSGDATLVVPCPQAELSSYAHLAAFVRGGSEEQIDALLGRTASEALARCGERPLWLSTSGAGVSWLHFRLDSRPKYYSHAPYRVP